MSSLFFFLRQRYWPGLSEGPLETNQENKIRKFAFLKWILQQGRGEAHAQILSATETELLQLLESNPTSGTRTQKKSSRVLACSNTHVQKSSCVLACSNTHVQKSFCVSACSNTYIKHILRRISSNMNGEISYRILTICVIIEFLFGENVYDTLSCFKKLQPGAEGVAH